MSGLAVHLPGTLTAFYFWLGAHWPPAPRGCQWQYGWVWHEVNHWRMFCR